MPKADIFDSLTDYSVSPTHLYLHRHTNQGEIVITSLELSTGKQQSQSVSLASLGLEGALVDSSNAYDPRCNRLLLFYSQGNGRFLGSYDFKDGTFAALPLTRPVSHVLATDSGYLLANTSSHRQVILYAYDLAWTPRTNTPSPSPLTKSGPDRQKTWRTAMPWLSLTGFYTAVSTAKNGPIGMGPAWKMARSWLCTRSSRPMVLTYLPSSSMMGQANSLTPPYFKAAPAPHRAAGKLPANGYPAFPTVYRAPLRDVAWMRHAFC